MIMSKILNLDLKATRRSMAGKIDPSETGGHTTGTIQGSGKKDFPFPTVDVLVKRATKRAAGNKRKSKKTEQTIVVDPNTPKVDGPASGLLDLGSAFKIRTVVPQGQTRETYEDGRVMMEGADGLQAIMIQAQFDALYESRFGDMRAAVLWATSNMSAKYQKSITSLGDQLTKLEDSYRQALPQVISEIAKDNPTAPANAVVQKAIEVLDEELAQILFILKVYTDCFAQLRDGKYTELLEALTYFFEETHRLYWSGDINGDGSNSPIKAGTERVGDIFLARVTDMGLATIPGSKGPVGAHAAQIQSDMVPLIAINLPLLGHEARHNVFNDVVGLEAELRAALAKSVIDAHKAGTLKFSTPTIKLGKQEVPTEQMIAKLWVDWLSESDADLVGGVLFAGTAFGENMIMSFPAMMIRDGKVSSKTKLLRTVSMYEVAKQKNGSVALRFEEHPIDYARVHLNAAALEEIGFTADAKKLRELADFAVGDELPTTFTWRQAGAKGGAGMVIEIPVADVLTAIPIVAKAIIRTPLKAQSGKSCGDLVMWTQKRQDKVNILVEILVAGKADVPTDKGDMHAPYVGAAATLAYLKLVREKKMEPKDAVVMVNKNALAMLQTLRKRTLAKAEGGK